MIPLKTIEDLISKLKTNKYKPQSKILSANIKVANKEEYDILDILQKYEGPFSDFSNNSIRVTDITEIKKNSNDELKLTIINSDVNSLEFINNSLICF